MSSQQDREVNLAVLCSRPAYMPAGVSSSLVRLNLSCGNPQAPSSPQSWELTSTSHFTAFYFFLILNTWRTPDLFLELTWPLQFHSKLLEGTDLLPLSSEHFRACSKTKRLLWKSSSFPPPREERQSQQMVPGSTSWPETAAFHKAASGLLSRRKRQWQEFQRKSKWWIGEHRMRQWRDSYQGKDFIG